LTALAPVKLVPVMVTEVPPAGRPDEGLTAVTVGAPISHVSPRLLPLLPPNKTI
jgi:hypothetical protein